MKKILAALLALGTSISTWATGYSTGTYHCASTDNALTSDWIISAFNDNLPYADVTTNEEGNVIEVRGIASVEILPDETMLGLPSLDTDGFFTIHFPNDGSKVTVGTMDCSLVSGG